MMEKFQRQDSESSKMESTPARFLIAVKKAAARRNVSNPQCCVEFMQQRLLKFRVSGLDFFVGQRPAGGAVLNGEGDGFPARADLFAAEDRQKSRLFILVAQRLTLLRN